MKRGGQTAVSATYHLRHPSAHSELALNEVCVVFDFPLPPCSLPVSRSPSYQFALIGIMRGDTPRTPQSSERRLRRLDQRNRGQRDQRSEVAYGKWGHAHPKT